MYLYSLNFPNGKIYLGVSINTQNRFKQHLSSKRNTVVKKAISKHGPPEIQILCEGPRDYILELEVKAIAAFKTQDRKFGYNVSPGGEFGPIIGRIVSEETRNRLRESSLKRWAEGRGVPKECRPPVNNFGENNPMFGRKHSEETKAKIKAKRALQITTPEAKEKMKSAQLSRWAKIKSKSKEI